MSETIIVPHKAAPRADLTEAKRLMELGMRLLAFKLLALSAELEAGAAQ